MLNTSERQSSTNVNVNIYIELRFDLLRITSPRNAITIHMWFSFITD